MVDTGSNLGMRFRSKELAETFISAYEAELARWPLPVTSMDVPGEFGTTRVQICGAPDGSPLVLLHGHGATSAVWFANIEELAQTHRIYAVDQLGDAGMSVAGDKPISQRDDYMSWLDGLLDHLDLRAAAFCGHSYGAWLALSYALHAPARVSKLVLVDPTECFAGLNVGYRLRALPLFIRPSAKRARHVIEWESDRVPLDSMSVTLACLGGGEFRGSKLVVPHPPNPDDLRSLNVATLILLAEKSRAHAIEKVRTAAERLLPDLSVAVLPGASHHSLPAASPDRLNEELFRFLA